VDSRVGVSQQSLAMGWVNLGWSNRASLDGTQERKGQLSPICQRIQNNRTQSRDEPRPSANQFIGKSRWIRFRQG
jgi:hypothetical protein